MFLEWWLIHFKRLLKRLLTLELHFGKLALSVVCGLIKRSDLELIWMRKPTDEQIGKVWAHWRHYSRAAKVGRKHMFGTVNNPRSAVRITMLISISSAAGSSGRRRMAVPQDAWSNLILPGAGVGEWGGVREFLWPCEMDGVGAGLWNQEIICLGNTLDYSLCLPLAPSKWSETFTDLSFQLERADGGPGSLSTTHLSALWTVWSFQRAVFGSQNVLGMLGFGSRIVPMTELLRLFLVNRKSMESVWK